MGDKNETSDGTPSSDEERVEVSDGRLREAAAESGSSLHPEPEESVVAARDESHSHEVEPTVDSASPPRLEAEKSAFEARDESLAHEVQPTVGSGSSLHPEAEESIVVVPEDSDPNATSALQNGAATRSIPSMANSAYFTYGTSGVGRTDYHRYLRTRWSQNGAEAGDAAPYTRAELPETHANVVSRWTFWWFESLVWRGWRRPLEDSDLYDMIADDKAELLSQRFRKAWRKYMAREPERMEKRRRRLLKKMMRRQRRRRKDGDGDEPLPDIDEEQLRSRWPMFWVLFRVHRRIIIVTAILKFFDVGLGQISPIFVNYFLTWLETPGAPRSVGFLWALAIFLSPFLKAFVENQYYYLAFRLAVRVRGEVQSTVYDKSLALSPGARAQTTTGEVVNHMQLDAQRLSDFMQYSQTLWAGLLQIAASLALLIVYLGYSGLIGFGLALLLVPLQAYLVKLLSAFRSLTFGFTDRRVKLLNEMFQGVKAMKLYAWEEPLCDKVTDIREQELAAYRRTVLMRTLFYVVLFVMPTLVTAGTFGFYGGVFRNALNPANIFAALTVLNNLRFPLIMYPFVITALVDARLGVMRLQRFLALEEIEKRQRTSEDGVKGGVDDDDGGEEDEEELNLKGDGVRKPASMPILPTRGGDGGVAALRISRDLLADRARTAGVVADEGDRVTPSASDNAGRPSTSSTDSSAKGEATAKSKGSLAALRPSSDDGRYAIVVRDATFEWSVQRTVPIAPVVDNVTVAVPRWRRCLPSWLPWIGRPRPPSGPREKRLVERTVAVPKVSLRVPRGALVGIVGRVGSGKSSLVAGMLGDLRRASGSVTVHGSIAYAAQNAWIYNGTVRDNILFGLPYDEKWYRRAVHVSALNADLDMLPAGDLTEIGEKGINLSGGQKQRVSVARLVYARADVNVLDDPLSALDAHVGAHVFEKVLSSERGVLRHRTRVLVTNHLQVVSRCDWVVVMEAGQVVAQGPWHQLMHDSPAFGEMMAALHAAEKRGEEEQQRQTSGAGNEAAELHDELDKPRDHTETTFDDAAAAADAARREEQIKDKQAGELVVTEEIQRGHVPLWVYWRYARDCGSPLLFLVVVSLFFFSSGESVVNNWWLSYWSENFGQRPLGFFLGIYFGLALFHALMTFVRTYWFLILALVAAKRLHEYLLHSVLSAPMAFYDVTPVGRILVRFSRDMMQIDFQLSQVFNSFLQQLASIAGSYVYIAVIFPIFVAALVPVLILYVLLWRLYNPANIQFRRLDSVSKAPIYAHFSETLNGLTTIRAYDREPYMRAVNRERIDINQRAYFHQIVGNRWLALRLEVLGSILVFITAIFGVTSNGSTYAGNVGLALSYSLSVTSALSMAVRSITEVEQQMNSVERNIYYTDSIPHEHLDGEDAPPDWPSRGTIQFERVSMRYRPNLPLVLQDVSMVIEGGERVGVLGRTGSGKSSLIAVLFRLVELSDGGSGRVLIDGVDIAALKLRQLRARLTIIPQDPVLFSGTVRTNLDPFGRYADHDLWDALRDANLDATVSSMSQGLESPVSEYGENLSAGQRQLICLARALLRRPRILVSDEATSSVDLQTDQLIQEVIRDKFERATVIAIAHRLFTLADFDTSLVMSHGRVVEHDDPGVLLQQPQGQFTRFVDSIGPQGSRVFRGLIAARAEMRRRRRRERQSEVRVEEVD